jgi:hypothetical protein
VKLLRLVFYCESSARFAQAPCEEEVHRNEPSFIVPSSIQAIGGIGT